MEEISRGSRPPWTIVWTKRLFRRPLGPISDALNLGVQPHDKWYVSIDQ